MPAEPIRYYHRARQTLETEQVYGEKWLRFTYENPLGQVFLGLLVKRKLFSWAFGWQMSKRVSANKILPFVLQYNLDVNEFAKSVFEYTSFNEFFSRKLKKEARPLAEGDDTVVFPADGRHLVFPDVDRAEGFYVKGAKFTLAELFGEAHLPEADRPLSQRYAGGAMVISRLCPVDYHRFHFPLAGTPSAARLIKGALFSVSPIALRKRVQYLVENKRALTLLRDTRAGQVAIFEVGATNVGSIVQNYVPDTLAKRGEEKGLFKFGGSCVITLFEKGRVRFDDDLVDHGARQVEVYAKMGERLGRALSA